MDNAGIKALVEFLVEKGLTIDDVTKLQDLAIAAYNKGWNDAIKEASNELSLFKCNYGCRFVLDHMATIK